MTSPSSPPPAPSRGTHTLRIEPKVLRALLRGEGHTFTVNGVSIRVERFGEPRKGPTYSCVWCRRNFDGHGARAAVLLHQHDECEGRPFHNAEYLAREKDGRSTLARGGAS